MSWIDCGEIGVEQLIFLALNLDDALLQVHLVKQEPILHLKVGTTLDGCCLEFELDDADGLVHLCHELGCTGTLGILGTAILGQKTLTGVTGIGVHGKGGKGQQVDAVAILEYAVVAIAQGDAQHIGNAAIVAGGCTHPQDIVVTPLDVKIVETAQDIHDFIRAGTTVIDITQDVQHVDCQLLDEVAHGDDELIDTMGRDNGPDDYIDIGLLIRVGAMLVQQLLDDVGEVLGQRLVNLRAAIFGRHMAADPDQTIDRDKVPIVHVLLVFDFLLNLLQFLDRIVNEGTQFLLLP